MTHTVCDEMNQRNGLCGAWQQGSVEFDRTQNNLTEELVWNCQDITAIENGSETDYQTHIHEEEMQAMMHRDKAHVSGMADGEDGPFVVESFAVQNTLTMPTERDGEGEWKNKSTCVPYCELSLGA